MILTAAIGLSRNQELSFQILCYQTRKDDVKSNGKKRKNNVPNSTYNITIPYTIKDIEQNVSQRKEIPF